VTRAEGTINHDADQDEGYTIEVCIPWTTLGLSGPPASGTTWGLEVALNDATASESFGAADWQNANGDNHNDPDGFGWLLFE
jgi:hypothetical protein